MLLVSCAMFALLLLVDSAGTAATAGGPSLTSTSGRGMQSSVFTSRL